MSHFMKIAQWEHSCPTLPVRRKDRLTDGWTDREADMTKLIVAFRNYAKAPKKFYLLCTVCIDVLCMYLRKNSDFGRHSSM
jgi:hypothetical protein